MHQDLFEDEVLSDTQSSASSSRRNSSISLYMATVATRSIRGSIGRQLSINDCNENKQSKQQHQQAIPSKKLVFSGKCSEIFKSTLIDCVEDCVLEFPGETLIYVPKSGQKSLINKSNMNFGLKDSNPYHSTSRKSAHRRNSITQSQNSSTTNLRPNSMPLNVIPSTRVRHQLSQTKFTLAEHITEEDSTDCQTSIQDSTTQDDDEHARISREEINSFAISQSFLSLNRKLPSARAYSSYRNRQRDFRLSDLVMNGPEYYAHVFNLPRPARYISRSTSRPRVNTPKQRDSSETKYAEFDLIKQDLFHRYLWTQKPQVSCRIRPMSTYTRSATFIL